MRRRTLLQSAAKKDGSLNKIPVKWLGAGLPAGL